MDNTDGSFFESSARNCGNIGKTERYSWVTKDTPGELKYIQKDLLRIHPAYQRDIIPSKVKEITALWSWVSAGVIIVGERGGEFWVIDGQHRVVSAKRRNDIIELPCIVFKTSSVQQEAGAFLDVNAGRKPISSLGKFKAMLAAGDSAAVIVHRVFEKYQITPKPTPSGPGTIKSVAWSLRKAKEDAQKFETVVRLAAELSAKDDMPIMEKLLDGLWYINENTTIGVLDARLKKRLNDVGAKTLLESANKAAAYFVRGGANVWAQGMMDAINKGLRVKFELAPGSCQR